MTLFPSLESLPKIYTGKVREVYDAGDDRLLLVTSSRVSAFDVVFPELVPRKAEVLNLLSAWWFERTRDLLPNHLIETRVDRLFTNPADCQRLRGRVALVRRTDPIRFECVVRGHLDGSAWREYQQTGAACGHALPPGLQRYDALPQPLFTPATKADTGHDENVTIERLIADLGPELTHRLRDLSVALYDFGRREVAARGLLLLDTKFEFGIAPDGQLLLIDEVMTPDSSRYRARPAAGGEAVALDKQFLRDWLTTRGFTGDGAPPALEPAIVAELSRRYALAYEIITGETIDAGLEARG